jgi:hypothetical protein
MEIVPDRCGARLNEIDVAVKDRILVRPRAARRSAIRWMPAMSGNAHGALAFARRARFGGFGSFCRHSSSSPVNGSIIEPFASTLV